ncbi:MAG: YicC family protein [Ignavibacteriae bacterium]|nr:YicC family protein [Ignavibacteriota bacterium]
MIYSMTGFGKSVVTHNGFNVEVEARSLNSRFLDVYIKLPKHLYNQEFEIRDLIKNNVKRGKLSLTVSVKKDGTEEVLPQIDKEAVKSLSKTLKEIKKIAKVKDDISLNHILNFQNLIFTDNSEDDESEIEFVKKGILEALKDLAEMRKKEGDALARDLKQRVNIILECVDKIESNAKISVENYFEKIKERAVNLVRDLAENTDRLNQELALLAERADVTEECVRLKSHIDIFLNTIETSDEAGRKLNFITQEMNREANTINSKSVSTEISHYGIQIKEELEKIREQIQNIE